MSACWGLRLPLLPLSVPFLFWLFVSLSSAQSSPQPSAQPYAIRWSSARGSDGPWNTIKVNYGGQDIDAYPAGAWESLIIRKEICNKALPSGTCYGREAGLYGPADSRTYRNFSRIAFSLRDEWLGWLESTRGDCEAALDTLNLFNERLELPDLSVKNHTTILIENGYRVLPNGTRYSMSVSAVSLGGNKATQSWTVDGFEHKGLLTSNNIFDQGITQSNSYGLHIGSPTVQLAGSLIFGGYDRSRVVGPPSVQPFHGDGSMPISLLDIGIGVAAGRSPFSFESKKGLLAEGNSSLTSLISVTVDVDGRDPYLYLPHSTCETIAKSLPVKHDPGLGLYIWQTDDPNYKRIIASAAYLGFTFRANNSATQNFTIKVPFRLLSLTLTEPLASTPTQYFPCSTPRLPSYSLGRAFLQAAFMAVNWGDDFKGVWILAQAPGPNVPLVADTASILPQDRMISTSEVSWENSWQGVWSPLPSTGTPSSTEPPDSAKTSPPASASSSNSSSSSSPSLALVIGMSVMGFVILVVTVALVALLVHRRRKTRLELATATHLRRQGDRPYYGRMELDSRGIGRRRTVQGVELNGSQSPRELYHDAEMLRQHQCHSPEDRRRPPSYWEDKSRAPAEAYVELPADEWRPSRNNTPTQVRLHTREETTLQVADRNHPGSDRSIPSPVSRFNPYSPPSAGSQQPGSGQGTTGSISPMDSSNRSPPTRGSHGAWL